MSEDLDGKIEVLLRSRRLETASAVLKQRIVQKALGAPQRKGQNTNQNAIELTGSVRSPRRIGGVGYRQRPTRLRA